MGGGCGFVSPGINNQNFIMRDEQTGSWWQQVTGARHSRGRSRGSS